MILLEHCQTNLAVRAANVLLKARKDCTMIQRKILYIAISQIDYDDREFADVTLSKGELVKLLGNVQGYYSRLENICDDLFTKRVTLESDAQREQFHKINIFEEMKYSNEAGLYFKFCASMKPYLLKLRERFATTPLMRVLCLDSNHAIALYELILAESWPGKDCFFISIDKLKRILGVENSPAYKQMCNFRRKCLNAPLKELNTKLGQWLNVNYEVHKEGRKVTGFTFTVMDFEHRWHEQVIDKANMYEMQLYGKFIRELQILTCDSSARGRFTERSAKKFLLTERPGIEQLIYNLEAVKEYAAKRKKENKQFIISAGVLTKAIKKDWRPNSSYYKGIAKKEYEQIIKKNIL